MLKGFDKLNKKLESISENAKELNGKHHIELDKLFNDSFMKKHTQFSSLEKLLEVENISVESFKSLLEKGSGSLDEPVKKHSSFNSWEDFQKEAVTELISKKLFK